MDAKDRTAFRDGIMTEVRQLLNAKFKGSTEEISDDSKVAIQQLLNLNSSLREEFGRLAAGAKLTSTCVEDLQRRVGVLESTPVSARSPADIANLKSSMVKLQEIVANDPTKALAASLETRLTEITSKISDLTRDKRSVPAPVTPDAAVPATPTMVLEAANATDPNAAVSVEVGRSDMNRRLTSLEGRIKAIPQPVPYDDSAIVQRLSVAESNLRQLSERVDAIPQTQPEVVQPIILPPQPTDLVPIQTSLASLEDKVRHLSGLASTFQNFDPTPLTSRIAKLEEVTAQNGHGLVAAPVAGLFGIGSPPNDVVLLKSRVDALEANFGALVKVGVSKGEFEPIVQQMIALKAQIDGLHVPAANVLGNLG